ncbi:MAG: hypothetical protein KF795_00530 [Labilithrix sp.]|nr:hypothetical protein [Labilithrix sp.]
MKQARRWSPCVDHRGPATAEFFERYFGDATRRCLLIAGGGFDPRSTITARALAAHAGDRLEGLFVREERRAPARRLITAAERHVQELQALVPRSRIVSLDILASDNAVVGGRNAVELLRQERFENVTDVLVDMSALSIGTSFPILRYLLEAAGQAGGPRNVHALVVSVPAVDERRRRVSNDVVSLVHSFHGTLRLHSQQESARLWIPQLSVPKMAALDRIHAAVPFDDVCPILPFPSKNPRAADHVAEHFLEQLERTWDVDARNVIHAAEDDPIDVYRTILDIEEQRRTVFEDRSVVVLSPVGTKAVALGSLMAALERDLPVVYVEALQYDAPPKELQVPADAELLHVWLHGDAYRPHAPRVTP